MGTVVFTPILATPNIAAPTFANATAGLGGSISPNGITKLNYGDNIAFTIAADGGYHLVDVLVNGTSIGATGSCSIENISGATEIVANFEVDPTPMPSPSSTATVTPSPSASPTASVAPSVTPVPTGSIEGSENFFLLNHF